MIHLHIFNKNKMEQNSFELNVQPEDAVFIQRQFLGKTAKDIEIENMPAPSKPVWLYVVVSVIRYYQKRISKKLGNRCVFDPSCSHFAESAFRKKGLIKGMILTTKRLFSCRPENGGIDEIK